MRDVALRSLLTTLVFLAALAVPAWPGTASAQDDDAAYLADIIGAWDAEPPLSGPLSGSLVQQAAWGPKRVADHVLESRIRLAVGQGIVGDSARQLQPQRVDDIRRDPRYVLDAENNLSELAVPIHHDGTLLGVLDSEHPEQGFYDDRHEQALVTIAAHGAARLWQLRTG